MVYLDLKPSSPCIKACELNLCSYQFLGKKDRTGVEKKG